MSKKLDKNMQKIFISGVILAAGFGKRAQCDKLLFPWKNHTLLFEALKHATFSYLDELIIIIQHRHLQLCQEYIKKIPNGCSKRIKIVVNTMPEDGMASSLRLGVKNCQDKSDAVLFLLTDQPFFNTADINALYTAYKKQKATIMAAYLGDERKNPVIFSLDLYKEELLKTTGDKGARELLKKYVNEVHALSYADPLKFIDIDTQSDYHKYKEKMFSWHTFLQPYSIVSIIGAGGKTSLMWNIAKELGNKEQQCIFSTTTKLWNTAPKDIDIMLASDIDRCKEIIASQRKNKHILLASGISSEQKLLGIDPSWFKYFIQEKNCKFIIEADGAKGKYFKVHASHEPCLPHKTDLVIITLNMEIMGKNLSDQYVHRAELLAQYFPLFFSIHESLAGSVKSVRKCSAQLLVDLLYAPSGYFSKMLSPHTTTNSTPFILFLNNVENKKNYAHAMRVIKLLEERQNPSSFLGVVYGSNNIHDYEFIPF